MSLNTLLEKLYTMQLVMHITKSSLLSTLDITHGHDLGNSLSVLSEMHIVNDSAIEACQPIRFEEYLKMHYNMNFQFQNKFCVHTVIIIMCIL